MNLQDTLRQVRSDLDLFHIRIDERHVTRRIRSA